MLEQRLREYVAPLLRADEGIDVAMAGFRPLTQSYFWVSVFPAVIAGIAVSAATGLPALLVGAAGGGVGAVLGAWLDQHRARSDHHGKGLGIGLVVTTRRFIGLDLTGAVAASVHGIACEHELKDLTDVETEKMQGSGLKRAGAVLTFRGGAVERVIPAKMKQFIESLAAHR